MVVALGPGRFYGSSLPRPHIYTDVKLNHDGVRVDPPVGVMDPFLSWANEAHWSMGGLNFKRLRLAGKIEGNIKKLRSDQKRKGKKLLKKNQESEMKNQNQNQKQSDISDDEEPESEPEPEQQSSPPISTSTISDSPPPAPAAAKRRRLARLLDDGSEDEEMVPATKQQEKQTSVAVSSGTGSSLRRRPGLRVCRARKLVDDFDRVAAEDDDDDDDDDSVRRSKNGEEKDLSASPEKKEVTGKRDSDGKKKKSKKGSFVTEKILESPASRTRRTDRKLGEITTSPNAVDDDETLASLVKSKSIGKGKMKSANTMEAAMNIASTPPPPPPAARSTRNSPSDVGAKEPSKNSPFKIRNLIGKSKYKFGTTPPPPPPPASASAAARKTRTSPRLSSG